MDLKRVTVIVMPKLICNLYNTEYNKNAIDSHECECVLAIHAKPTYDLRPTIFCSKDCVYVKKTYNRLINCFNKTRKRNESPAP